MELNLSSVWSSACSILKSELSDASYNSYITSLRPLSLENGRILLQVPDERVLATLNKQEYYNFIKSALVAASRRDLSPVFTIEEPRVEASAPSRSGLQLNPRYTFDTFVVGEGNRLAWCRRKAGGRDAGQQI